MRAKGKKRKLDLEDRLEHGDVQAFEECLHIMKTGADGMGGEIAFHMLLPHCKLFVPELIEAFRAAELRDFWICELLTMTKSPLIISALLDCIGTTETCGESDSCRAMAQSYLRELLKEYGTKEARQLLWDMRDVIAKFYGPEHDAALLEFHRCLVELGDLVDSSRINSTF